MGTTMSKGRYTGYQFFQQQAFQEAESGRTHPYTTSAYGCPWSQRAYLFHFEDYQQRTQFDAANTSCCSDPVRPFHYKPQYADQGKPMVATDCDAKVQVAGCNVVKTADQGVGPCASSAGAGVQTGILIRCPTACPDLGEAQAGRRIRGVHGDFVYVNTPNPDVIQLQYYPDASVLIGAWGDCATRTYVEMLCGELPVTITISAGVTKPNGCYCDCCAHLTESHSSTGVGPCVRESGGWGNRIYCSGGGGVSPVCSGDGENLAIYWTSEDYAAGLAHTWESPPILYPYGSAGWKIGSGVPGWAGDGDQSFCCGLSGKHCVSQGCGYGSVCLPQNWGAKKPTSCEIYASGSVDRTYYSGDVVQEFTTLRPGQRYPMSGWQACSFANKALLDFRGWNCLEDTFGSLEREIAKVVRSTGDIQLQTGRCAECCGFGSFTAWFNNGCDDVVSRRIMVRDEMASGNGDLQVGRVLKCTATGNPGEYKVQEAPLRCNGSNGAFTDGAFSYVPAGTGIENCNAAIGSGAEIIRYDSWPQKACLSGTHPSCCYYSQNGESGSGFRAYIWQISGHVCCPDIPRVAGYYVRQEGACCPAWDQEEWN